MSASMGSLTDFKATFDKLIADLHKQFQGVNEHFDAMNTRLTTIEQA